MAFGPIMTVVTRLVGSSASLPSLVSIVAGLQRRILSMSPATMKRLLDALPIRITAGVEGATRARLVAILQRFGSLSTLEKISFIALVAQISEVAFDALMNELGYQGSAEERQVLRVVAEGIEQDRSVLPLESRLAGGERLTIQEFREMQSVIAPLVRVAGGRPEALALIEAIRFALARPELVSDHLRSKEFG